MTEFSKNIDNKNEFKFLSFIKQNSNFQKIANIFFKFTIIKLK